MDELGFSQHIGVNDNGLWRYDEETQFESDGDAQPQQRGTPFIIRAATGFKVDLAEEAMDQGSGGRFLSEVVRGIGVYEFNMRVTTPGAVRPGSVFNYRS